MSNSVFALQVSPSIPPPLQRLDDLAKNFWFSWNPALGQLFRKLDPVLWRKVEGSPRLFLRSVDQGILERAATDPASSRSIGASSRRSTTTSAASRRSQRRARAGRSHRVLLRRVRLARELSDLLGRLGRARRRPLQDGQRPAPAVRRRRAAYRQGYFTSASTATASRCPSTRRSIRAARRSSIAMQPRRQRGARDVPGARPRRRGARLEGAGRPRDGAAARHGRPENVAEDRKITHVLYGGEHELRQQQEAVLGVGGVRALRALGLAADRVAHQRGPRGVSRARARCASTRRRACRSRPRSRRRPRSTVFTTHTPVSAGHDVFPPDRVARQFAGYPAELGITAEQLLDLGRAAERADVFNMTRLALRGAAAVNGVSKIHGQVSSRLCASALARRAAGREPRRLRHERRARRRRSCARRGPSCSTSTSAPTGATG